MLSGRFNGESSLSLFKEMGKENGYLREMNAQKGHGNKGLAESARVCKNQRMDAMRDEKASQKWYGSLNDHISPKRDKTSSCVGTVTKESTCGGNSKHPTLGCFDFVCVCVYNNEPITSTTTRSCQSHLVSTISQRLAVLEWMKIEISKTNEKGIAAKAIKIFPHLFCGNHKAKHAKATNWWKNRELYLKN